MYRTVIISAYFQFYIDCLFSKELFGELNNAKVNDFVETNVLLRAVFKQLPWS